ncbi:hypothetical protein HYALB_00005387 [Hymenoscyphus albidus]|uniref:WSC domain-containing protein n=1 Tax=Hymenoscyphus albidus TaxID=595503 RepID=A0A9N9LF57_9HELO|nr:hypothetical protein HYALB_00005387 [Hymenoscyphus albidus]
MRSPTMIVAASLLMAASSVTALLEPKSQGCYSDLSAYTFNNTAMYQTEGLCQTACAPAGYNAMATTKGSDCWCGAKYPPASLKVDDALCDTPCAGFGEKTCGGDKYFTVYTSGRVAKVETETASGGSSSSAPPSTTSSAPPSVVTVPGETILVTAAPGTTSNAAATSSAPAKSSGGPSKAGIAAGVVVGILALAAIAGGAFLFIRNKNRREVEEEYRRNAAVSSFIAGGGKPPTSSGGASSFNDTRLDPSVMAQRRMSDGSIADNQDYSRRILKVTNA